MNARANNKKAICQVPEGPLPHIKEMRRDLPIMLYDGDCGFCQRWIDRCQKITGENIQYIPYQFFTANKTGKLIDFPSLSIHDCKKAVQLILPGGERSQAVKAIFLALAQSGKQKWWLWLYKYLPGFKLLAEVAYKFIAGHRYLL